MFEGGNRFPSDYKCIKKITRKNHHEFINEHEEDIQSRIIVLYVPRARTSDISDRKKKHERISHLIKELLALRLVVRKFYFSGPY